MSIKSASPTTQKWVDEIRKELQEFDSTETKHYVKFVSPRDRRTIAWINPLKQHARLFLLLPSSHGTDLRRGPSTGSWSKWTSVFYIERDADLARAKELIEESDQQDLKSGGASGRRRR